MYVYTWKLAQIWAFEVIHTCILKSRHPPPKMVHAPRQQTQIHSTYIHIHTHTYMHTYSGHDIIYQQKRYTHHVSRLRFTLHACIHTQVTTSSTNKNGTRTTSADSDSLGHDSVGDNGDPAAVVDDNMSWDIDEISCPSNDTASERRGEEIDENVEVCMFIYIYIYTYICVCVYICMYICCGLWTIT
jgi:hypothetical protein